MSNSLHNLFLKATAQKKEQKGSYTEILHLISDVEKEEYSYLIGVALAAKKVGNDSFAINLLSIIYNDSAIREAMFNPFEGVNMLNQKAEVIITSVSHVNQLLEIQRTIYNNRPIPSGMKKILKGVLEKATIHELKLNLDKSRTVTLRDSIKLLHPKPQNAKRADFFVDIIRNRVKTGRINESISSVCRKYMEGQFDSSKVIKFIRQSSVSSLLTLVTEMSSRNILDDANIVSSIEEVLLDEFKIEQQNVQPFEVFMALEFLDLVPISKEVERLQVALKEAFHSSVSNVRFPTGRNLILVDTSYSMEEHIPAGFHGMNASQVSILLGAIALVKGKGEVKFFDDRVHSLKIKTDNILEVYNEILELEKQDGYSNFKNALGEILTNYNDDGTQYDNVIVLTNRDNYKVQSDSFIISYNNMKHWRNRSGGVKDFRSPEQLSNDLCETGIFKQLFILDMSGDKEDFYFTTTENNYKVLLSSWCDNLDLFVNAFNKMNDGFDSLRLIEAYIE